MKTRALIIAAFLAIAGATAAVAEDEDCEARIGDWQPRSAVVAMAEQRGWTVQRIKTDDGCYEIRCTDRDGRSFEAIVDPATLAVLATRDRHGDHEGDDHGGRESGARGEHDGGHDGGHRSGGDDDDDDDEGEGGASPAPTGPSDPHAPVPDNGLFKGKVRPKVQVQ